MDSGTWETQREILTTEELCCPLLGFWDGATKFCPLCLNGKLELDHGGGLEAGDVNTLFSSTLLLSVQLLGGLLEMLLKHVDLWQICI